MIDRKSLSRVEVKDEARGEVVAVFATLNVIDSDKDVTRKGAFEDGAPVRISAYGHSSWDGRLPVGRGAIREAKNEAIMEGRLFLDTTEGRDTFTVVKEMGDLGEWSYGFDATAFSYGEFEGQEVRFLEKLKVYEVSPVLLGSGVGTRTVAAKSGGLKFAEHIDAVLADVDALAVRAAEVVALRSEKGKGLSDVSAAHLARLAESVKRLEGLLGTPATDNTADEVEREFARFVSLTA